MVLLPTFEYYTSIALNRHLMAVTDFALEWVVCHYVNTSFSQGVVQIKKRNVFGTLAIFALVATAIVGGASTAQAAPPGYVTFYYVVDSSFVSNHVNTGNIIARCYATGGTCTVTSGHTATISIDLSLGASRSDIAGGLGISASNSTTVTVGCTSPVLSSGEAWTAYPVGREYTYKVEEQVHAGYKVTTSYSGTLHAFSPYSNQIACS